MTIEKDYTITQVVNNEYRDFALYTVEDRAIPSLMDGLKPVQRFYLYSSLVNSKDKFKKVSAVAGVVSDYGYNHGEGSAMDAGQLMAAEWNNNYCIIEGQGSFGSRFVPVAAAPRYTFSKVHENFFKMFKDFEHCPEHLDFEHLPPAFYLPVLPTVLINGAHGIATGFAVKMLSRDVDSVKKAVKDVLDGKKLKPNSIQPKIPKCENDFSYDKVEGKWIESVPFERPTPTKIILNDVLSKYSREKYINLLMKLEDESKIVNYVDDCSKKGFRFEITLKRGVKWTDEKLIKLLDLKTTHTENINVLNEEGKLLSFECVEQIVEYFISIKEEYLEKRISYSIEKFTEKARYSSVIIEYIEAVLDGKVCFERGKKRDLIVKEILKETSATKDDIPKLLSMPMTSLTDEKVKDLKQKVKEDKAELKYWKSTDETQQYYNDLKDLEI